MYEFVQQFMKDNSMELVQLDWLESYVLCSKAIDYTTHYYAYIESTPPNYMIKDKIIAITDINVQTNFSMPVTADSVNKFLNNEAKKWLQVRILSQLDFTYVGDIDVG